MAINDTTALGLPAGRSATRRRRTLTGHASAFAHPCPADVDATPLHPLVTATATPSPHQALLALLEAHNAVSAELSLPRVLQRVVEAAREITGARYATLTLSAPDGASGTRVDSGVWEETLSGVPSAPTDPDVPDRQPRTADQRPSHGWPPGRSRYRSFRVPLNAQGSVLGHLQVSGPGTGRMFSADDEDLVAALAVTAAIAVENVRSSEELHRQESPPAPANTETSQWLRLVGGDERVPLPPGQG